MKIIHCVVFSIPTINCNRNASNKDEQFTNLREVSSGYETIGEIPTPPGYKRIIEERNSFGAWLRKIDLKHDPGIYLFNGRLRDNQSTHFAVLDIPVGDKDLQQCADAIMRLRAEYFFNQDNIDSIRFKATDGTDLSFVKWMKGERYRLKGARLVAYSSGTFGGNKNNKWSSFSKLSFIIAERFH